LNIRPDDRACAAIVSADNANGGALYKTLGHDGGATLPEVSKESTDGQIFT
jgi:hypothetical protein